MAATASPVAPTLKPGVAPLRAGQGNSFLLRRLHSLSGIVPIGAFLLEHFISNFEAFHGPEAYGRQVAFLNSLPFVLAMDERWQLSAAVPKASSSARRADKMASATIPSFIFPGSARHLQSFRPRKKRSTAIVAPHSDRFCTGIATNNADD